MVGIQSSFLHFAASILKDTYSPMFNCYMTYVEKVDHLAGKQLVNMSVSGNVKSVRLLFSESVGYVA